MKEVKIRKNGKIWQVTGLMGMSSSQLEDIAKQILSSPGLTGDTILNLETRRGIEKWSVSDFSNDSARGLLLERL